VGVGQKQDKYLSDIETFRIGGLGTSTDWMLSSRSTSCAGANVETVRISMVTNGASLRNWFADGVAWYPYK